MIASDCIRSFLTNTIEKTDFSDLGVRYQGKVRDVYIQPHRRILVATDRQSAFDIQWCTIPLKGQVLNRLSAWWFERVKDVMPTQVISVPDPNAMVVKNLRMVPVEIIVRSYLTGSTHTSVWVNYEQGIRHYCGNALTDGMLKNQKLPETIITPTTKSEEDELIDPKGIIDRGLATSDEWEEITESALRLFRRGQEIAAERGLILVDTKYEMGYDENGILHIADEVHTPDSSRYWVQETYEERFGSGKEPQALDKEFFRLWLREQGFDPSDSRLTVGQALGASYSKPKPKVTDDVRVLLASRYIDLYEKMTGESFEIEEGNVIERMEKNLSAFRERASVS